MKRICTLYTLRFVVALTFILGPATAQAQFTSGNVVVLQAGTGSAALSGAATPIVLKEYNTSTANQTSPIRTVYIDTTGAARLTLSGTATSEGQMTLSADGRKLIIAGYDAAIGTASVASSASGTVARVIDTLSYIAVPGRADSTRTVFSFGNIRAAVRDSSENYWAVGSSMGIYYMGNTATPDTIYNSTVNLRMLQAVNGKLYFSTGSGLSRIGRINTQPTSGFVGADTVITLGSGTTPSPYGFAVNSAENIVFVADDRTTINGGGIQKWTRSGSAWTYAYTLSTGGTNGARSVIVDWNGANPVVYAITAIGTGTLIKITDSNATGAAPAVTLATAPTNTAFRSVAFAPISCVMPVVTLAPSGTISFCKNNSVVLRTNNTPGLTYTWKKNGVVLTGPGNSDSTITVSMPGIYKVIVSAGTACTDSSANDTVVVNLPPANFLTRICSDTVCGGDTIRILSSAGAGVAYQWRDTTGMLVTTDSNLVIATPGTIAADTAYVFYSITTSAEGCSDTSTTFRTIVTPSPSPAIVNNANVLSTGNYASYQWYLNGAAISGANSMSYTPTANGTYAVSVTNANGCPGRSADIVVTGVGINEVLSQQGIRLYPNPVRDVLRIEAPFEVTVIIKDVQGRIVQRGINIKQISLQQLPAGVFTVTIYKTSGILLGTQMIVKSAQ